MDLYYHRHGGIHLVVLDGIADLIRSANDEAEKRGVAGYRPKYSGQSIIDCRHVLCTL